MFHVHDKIIMCIPVRLIKHFIYGAMVGLVSRPITRDPMKKWRFSIQLQVYFSILERLDGRILKRVVREKGTLEAIARVPQRRLSQKYSSLEQVLLAFGRGAQECKVLNNMEI